MFEPILNFYMSKLIFLVISEQIYINIKATDIKQYFVNMCFCNLKWRYYLKYG